MEADFVMRSLLSSSGSSGGQTCSCVDDLSLGPHYEHVIFLAINWSLFAGEAARSIRLLPSTFNCLCLARTCVLSTSLALYSVSVVPCLLRVACLEGNLRLGGGVRLHCGM